MFIKSIMLPALLVSSFSFAGKEVASNTAEYRVDAYSSYDSYVHEWTPKENKNVRCVFIVNQNRGESGLSCYEVEASKKN